MPQLRAISRYNRLALRVSEIGKIDTALFSLSSAQRLAREVRRPALEAFSRCNMGVVYLRAGRPEEALSCFRLAMDIAMLDPLRTRSVRRIIERKLARLQPN